ncbi:MAG: hypothetical protein PUB73_05890 [Bacteroidales bacterium]|nr:hypothetical protein [Bacteroidales bacterium]
MRLNNPRLLSQKKKSLKKKRNPIMQNLPRPRKKRKGKKRTKRNFNETRIGFLLEHQTPLEYRILLEASGVLAPTADLIETISYASLDPFFRTDEFRQALMEYRQVGLYPKYRTKTNINKELDYIKYRRRKAASLKNY